jgi:hypothetical protein
VPLGQLGNMKQDGSSSVLRVVLLPLQLVNDDCFQLSQLKINPQFVPSPFSNFLGNGFFASCCNRGVIPGGSGCIIEDCCVCALRIETVCVKASISASSSPLANPLQDSQRFADRVVLSQ